MCEVRVYRWEGDFIIVFNYSWGCKKGLLVVWGVVEGEDVGKREIGLGMRVWVLRILMMCNCREYNTGFYMYCFTFIFLEFF